MSSPTARKLISPYRQKQEDALNAVTPFFQSRKSLAHHIKDNMLCAGRHGPSMRFEMKHIFTVHIQEAIKSPDEKLTGLIILTAKYTLACIEGPEDIVGRFVGHIVADSFLDASKVVLIYNNMNQSFFRKIVWRYADLPDVVLPCPEGVDQTTHVTKEFVKKMYKLCKFVRDEEADECIGFRSCYLSPDYAESTPDINQLEEIFTSTQLLTLNDFVEIYGKIPSFEEHAEQVWPIPFDFVPDNLFSWEEYDINLNFDNRAK